MSRFLIKTPPEFSAKLCVEFLLRSPKELLHRVEGDRIMKLILYGEQLILFSVTPVSNGLRVEVLTPEVEREHLDVIRQYVRFWFDLDTDLKPFYRLAKSDELLKDIVKRYAGYRIVGQPDLYESLVWAVLGQQINLSFAYQLKQRLVEKYGYCLSYGGQTYYAFPSPADLMHVPAEDLLALQFSRQKAAYTIGISAAFASGELSTELIASLPFEQAKEKLMSVKGIGNWTANYGLMKTFRYPEAFPLEDAGLHNAIKNKLGLKTKPSLKRVKTLFRRYRGWEAYATLYLWKSLEDPVGSAKFTAKTPRR
ncbi:MAG: DNA-3-methyladenine glycosylase [Cyclobacteriaceae bacterium]|nr:DNA-3-methyladenine glycosylase [Cyclobacteriaceae bacterium]